MGSEMCIRDSVPRVIRYVLDAGKVAPQVPGPGAGGRTRAGWKFCLLYTSDAADELLCVDLGGRRIIKKTKT
mgnify:CR=1 FL=1